MVTLDDKRIEEILEKVKSVLINLRDRRVDSYNIVIDSDDMYVARINGEASYIYNEVVVTLNDPFVGSKHGIIYTDAKLKKEGLV